MNHSFEIDFHTPAYLIRGGAASRTALIAALEERSVSMRGNPDVLAQEFETFSIDDARALAAFASLRPLGERKIILVSAQGMTREAQNALLKVVEEGSGHSIFFFIIPAGVPVLPTLLSRCTVVQALPSDRETERGEAFLRLGYADRLKAAEAFAKTQDREGARMLVRSLLALADEKKFGRELLRDLMDADRYLQLTGSSSKAVIGHLALVL